MTAETHHLIGVPLQPWQSAGLEREKHKVKELIGNQIYFINNEFLGISFASEEDLSQAGKIDLDCYFKAARVARKSLCRIQTFFKLCGNPVFLLADEEHGIDVECNSVFGMLLQGNKSAINWDSLKTNVEESNNVIPGEIWGKINDLDLTLIPKARTWENVVYAGIASDPGSEITDTPYVVLFRVVRTPMTYTRLFSALINLTASFWVISKEGGRNPKFCWWALGTGDADQLVPYYRDADLRRDEFVRDDSTVRQTLHKSQLAALVEIESMLGFQFRYTPDIRKLPWVGGYSEREGDVVGLGLARCNIQKLPPDIKSLAKLAVLDLRENSLREIPSEVYYLSALEELRVSRNNLATLRPEVGQLQHLQILNAAENQLAELPASFAEMHDLRDVNLSRNKFSRVPPPLLQVPNMEHLHLAFNIIRVIPSTIAKLTSLRILDLERNQIRRLPSTFSHVPHLNELNLKKNPITRLPDGFHQLTELQILDLDGTRITKFPEQLLQMVHLEVLRPSTWEEELNKRRFFAPKLSVPGLNHNIQETQKKARKQPRAGGPELRNRTSPSINAFKPAGVQDAIPYYGSWLSPSDYAAIVSLEEVLGEPIPEVRETRRGTPKFGFYIEDGQVVSIFLTKKNLESLPECIAKFRHLKIIEAVSNAIKTIPPHILELETLVTLDLTANRIQEIPLEIGKLSHIQTLHLMMNEIKEIPESIGILENLQTFTLADNKILKLPEAVKSLKKLRFLNLMNNPLDPTYHRWIIDLRNKKIHVIFKVDPNYC